MNFFVFIRKKKEIEKLWRIYKVEGDEKNE